MTGRTHDAIAFASLITIATFYPPARLNLATASACIVANIVGGTLPDIDQASNRLWDLLPFGDNIGSVVRRIFMGHRTITHSLIGVFIFTSLFLFAIPKIFNSDYINGDLIFWALEIGYISHLFGDALTKDGLPLFFPFPIKIGIPPFRFMRITAGSWVENLIVLPGTAFYIFWFIGRYQSHVNELLKMIIS